MTKSILKWRLSKLPTVEELTSLITNKIITQEEARDILFSSKDDTDIDNLKSEIKFLKDLIDKLSSKQQVIEIIKQIEPWHSNQWYKPYEVWCSTDSASSLTNGISNINTF